MASKIQETLRRIQEEAKERAERRFGIAPSVASSRPSLEDALTALRENITTAVAQALCTKAARRYIGDVTERLQDLATAAVAGVQADNDFGNALRDDTGVVIYPNNCKLLVMGNNGYGSLVIEEGPQLRTIYGPGGQTYRVPMPYIVFLIGFRQQQATYAVAGFGVGFGKEPLESVDQNMQLPRLPHTSGNTHVCQPLPQKAYKTIKQLAEGSIQVFWNTAFHYKFEHNLGKQNSKFSLKDGRHVNSFDDWEQIGRDNPLDILTGKFGAGDTVRNVLKTFGRVETRDRNTANQRIQGAVARVVNGVSDSLSATELAEIIRQTAIEIVNVALQNAVGNSALQPVKIVV